MLLAVWFYRIIVSTLWIKKLEALFFHIYVLEMVFVNKMHICISLHKSYQNNSEPYFFFIYRVKNDLIHCSRSLFLFAWPQPYLFTKIAKENRAWPNIHIKALQRLATFSILTNENHFNTSKLGVNVNYHGFCLAHCRRCTNMIIEGWSFQSLFCLTKSLKINATK